MRAERAKGKMAGVFIVALIAVASALAKSVSDTTPIRTRAYAEMGSISPRGELSLLIPLGELAWEGSILRLALVHRLFISVEQTVTTDWEVLGLKSTLTKAALDRFKWTRLDGTSVTFSRSPNSLSGDFEAAGATMKVLDYEHLSVLDEKGCTWKYLRGILEKIEGETYSLKIVSEGSNIVSMEIFHRDTIDTLLVAKYLNGKLQSIVSKSGLKVSLVWKDGCLVSCQTGEKAWRFSYEKKLLVKLNDEREGLGTRIFTWSRVPNYRALIGIVAAPIYFSGDEVSQYLIAGTTEHIVITRKYFKTGASCKDEIYPSLNKVVHFFIDGSQATFDYSKMPFS